MTSVQQRWPPRTFQPPDRVRLVTGHHLRPIRETDVDRDYPAVMGSRERLWEIYGEAWGWPPATMTPEEDRLDLARHEDRMARRDEFTYALWDPPESELLGCLYIQRPRKEGADAEITWWLVDRLADGEVEQALAELVPAWIAAEWPFERPRYIGRDLSWSDWLALPDLR